ncbi:hypothetical protein ACFW42_05050 [Streptomyces albidoflavus]
MESTEVDGYLHVHTAALVWTGVGDPETLVAIFVKVVRSHMCA